MDTTRFGSLARALDLRRSRRGLLGLVTGAGLPWPGPAGAAKKKRRKKRRKCGKAGRKPVKGKCCSGSILNAGACVRCDVCASGCAFSSVQAAVNAVNSLDAIVICPGTFTGDLLIEKDLRLVGAGADATILQGTGTDTVVRVEANTVDLENLHITGGNSMFGGGVENAGSTLTLRNVLVSGCVAEFNGGGIFNNDTLHLIASEVRGNQAADGGGIYLLSGSGNTVTADGASRVTGNTASNAGGGIYNDNAMVVLASTAIVSGNMPTNCAGTAVANCNG